MKRLLSYCSIGIYLVSILMIFSCEFKDKPKKKEVVVLEGKSHKIKIEAENLTHSSEQFKVESLVSKKVYVKAPSGGWIAFDVDIPIAGRYKSEIQVSSASGNVVNCWIEDYYDNKDNRTYNITGNMTIQKTASNFFIASKDGSPLNKGLHKMKLHFSDSINIDWVRFTLLKEHTSSPKIMTQSTEGSKWSLVWADEFNQEEIDTTKWTYDVGNWGWGNDELQYYTANRKENARIENNNLIIEARKADMGEKWTSARLTTRGKVSFLYGKIEFRAKVPPYKGNWAAGWTLGNDYVDELSWPYCGEIDILESVGYEMDDATGNGIAHASAHSGARYFKLGNQPTNTVAVFNMNSEYHTYSVEWSPKEIKVLVDDNPYFYYNDKSSELSWPFSKPQNLILNLTIGGGWGGVKGMDEMITSQKMIIDYVRVYELQ